MDDLAQFRTDDSLPVWARGYHISEPRKGAYLAKRPAAAPLVPGEPSAPLQDSIRQLRLAQSVITVAIAALRRQNADNDADVALVLERYASDRLDIEIERLARLHTQA